MRDRVDPRSGPRDPEDEALRPLSGAERDRLTPAPPRELQLRAVHAARRSAARAVLLRPPSGAWDAGLDALGGSGTPVVPLPEAPPDGTELPPCVASRLDSPEAFHLPRLERWFVRHHDGIGLLRTLLAALARRATPWSLDVGPWAWAWMRGVLPEARALPEAWGPEPLDGPQAAAWIDPPEDVWLRGSGAPPEADTYAALAARGHGDAGVIAAVWRASLAVDGHGERVWLRRPAEVTLPELEGASREALVMLHAALVHAEARPDTLARAVPFAPGTALAGLAELEARGVLRRGEDDRYRVPATALPNVRTHLRAQSFPGAAA